MKRVISIALTAALLAASAGTAMAAGWGHHSNYGRQQLPFRYNAYNNVRGGYGDYGASYGNRSYSQNYGNRGYSNYGNQNYGYSGYGYSTPRYAPYSSYGYGYFGY